MERETVTKFDLEAAFKALDEIACPDVSGKGRFTPNRINLKERLQAKHAHEVLVEDYFDVSMEEDLNDAQEQREAEVAKAKLARIEKIVDLDAESEEDILPSYVGKVIMQCPQCMTLFYKNEEDIEKSEETPDVVNINEICQHCGNSSGYTLVGKVGGVDEAEMGNFEGGEESAAEEGVEDELNLDFPEEGTEEIDAEGTGEGAEEMDLDLDIDLGDEGVEEEPAEEEEETNESLHNSKMLADIEKKNDLKTEIESEHLTLNEELEEEQVDPVNPDAIIEAVEESMHNSELLDKIEDKNELKTDIESEHLTLSEDMELMGGNGIPKEPADAVDIYIDKSGSGAQADRAMPMVKDFVEQNPDTWVNIYYFRDSFSYSEPLAAAKAGRQVRVYTDDDYTTNCPELADFENVTLINVMQDYSIDSEAIDEAVKYNKVDSLYAVVNGGKQVFVGTKEECENWLENRKSPSTTMPGRFKIVKGAEVPVAEELNTDETKVEEPITEAADLRIFVDQSGSLAGRKDEIMAKVAADYPGFENQIEIFDDAECAGPLASAEAGQKVVVYTNGDCEANCPALCKIATIKNVDETVTEELDADAALTEDAEMDELLDELWDGPQPTDAEIEADLAIMSQEAEDEEVFEEFDDNFDTKVTEYLSDVYSNVEKYESTTCAANDKKLIIEGKITFKSGKTKATQFVFESTKRSGNKIAYKGMNESLAGATKAFRMTCKAEGTKLVTESFKYIYKIEESFVRGSK